jgi:hypothetical protein
MGTAALPGLAYQRAVPSRSQPCHSRQGMPVHHVVWGSYFSANQLRSCGGPEALEPI